MTGDPDPVHRETELAHLAHLIRRAVATIDAETRERLEAAWVALTSAIKQPQQDAARVKARLARLRGEIERALGAREAESTAGTDGGADGRSQITGVGSD